MPNVFIANMMGLKPFEFFEAEEEAREVPHVAFGPPTQGPARRSHRRRRDHLRAADAAARAVATAWTEQNVLVYDRIGENRRNTFFLLAVFIIVVGAVLVAIGIALGLPCPFAPFLIVPAIICALFSYYSSTNVTLAISQAHPVTKEEEPDYYQTVENLCIGAGLPMPKLYVIEDRAPNAFATGRDPNHAVICVTRGLLQKMDHLELEGVIAHELSHIGNYDIRLVTVVVVLVGIVALLADFMFRFTIWGAGCADGQSRAQRRLGGDHHLRHRAHRRDPGADSRAAHPTGAVAAAGVPGRRLGGAADALSGGAGERAGEDRRRQRAAGRGEQGDGAPVHRQPAERALELAEQPLLDAPADREAHRPPPRDVDGAAILIPGFPAATIFFLPHRPFPKTVCIGEKGQTKSRRPVPHSVKQCDDASENECGVSPHVSLRLSGCELRLCQVSIWPVPGEVPTIPGVNCHLKGDKRMRRKRFWCLTLVALTATLTLAIVACGGGTKKSSTTPTAGAGAAAPADQQVLVAQSAEPEFFDPQRSNFEQDIAIARMLFRGLYQLELDSNDNVIAVPAMADGEPQVSGNVYTIKLKTGLKWSDGQPLTAKDFEYSLKRECSPDTAGPYEYVLGAGVLNLVGCDDYLGGTGTIDQIGVKAVDDTTLQMTLVAPKPNFTTIMSLWPTFPIRQDIVTKFGDKWTDPANIVDNGPYILTEYVAKDHVTLQPNPNWALDPKPQLQKLTIKFIDDQEVAFRAFQTGELDMTQVSAHRRPNNSGRPDTEVGVPADTVASHLVR